MGPTLDPAVHHDIDLVTHGINDFGKLIECRSRAVELASAMV
jgi:hypothetical protein